ncbi:MAG: hypothetical protein FJW14_09075 [Acidimicrobiia bacterium]|nr:hypothetical protein [Acidimicrobiia bacterium]
MRSSRGFALFGVLVVLAVIAMGLSVMVVLADRLLDEDRVAAVTGELEEIYRAVVGNQRDTFGYIGEIGAYPASLHDLVVNPGNAGWRGPYLRDPRVGGGMLLDPWGQPYEYWVVDGVATSDRLAIVSRGADGLSTNTAADPNIRTSYTGVEPYQAAYFSDPKNADNVVFPRPDASRADTLNVNTDSSLNIAINNFDSNSQVNAFVPACPNLFTITVQNTSRETNEVNAVGYAPGFQVTLPQGTYRVFVTSVVLPTPPVNDRIVVFPVVPVYRTYNVTGLDSSGTDQFVLTMTNKYPVDDIVVAQFGSNQATLNPNETEAIPIKACATVNVKIGGSVVESFTMPYGNFSKIAGATAAAITIDNNLNVTVNVYRNGLFIGDIKKNKVKTFSDDLVAGDLITATRADNGVLVKTVTLVAGSQTAAVP